MSEEAMAMQTISNPRGKVQCEIVLFHINIATVVKLVGGKEAARLRQG